MSDGSRSPGVLSPGTYVALDTPTEHAPALGLFFPEVEGAVGDGTTDDTAALQAVLAAVPAQGGQVYLRARYAATADLAVADRPVAIQGCGPGQTPGTLGSGLVFTGNAGLILDNCDGASLRSFAIEGSGMTAGALLDIKGTSGGFYQMHVEHVRVSGGYNNVRLRNGFFAKFFNCVIKDPTGEASILMNGSSDADAVQACEFTNCNIAGPQDAATTTDCVVMDGQVASTKFTSCSFLYGRRGIWTKDTTVGTDPSFIYVTGGGFENQRGSCVRLDAAAKALFTGMYASSDGATGKVIDVGSGFGGDLTVSGCYLRGGGGGGVIARAGFVNISGSTIVNNNAPAQVNFTVTGAANNGSGLIRLTTSAAHHFETDDMVVVASVGGTTEANGRWIVTVIDATTVDLARSADTAAASAFVNAYTSGGTIALITANVRILSAAEFVSVSGNRFGKAAAGSAATEYGVHNEALNVSIVGNECSGALVATVRNLANSSRTRERLNTGDILGGVNGGADGTLSVKVAGAITTGLKDFTSAMFVSGVKIRVIRYSRQIGSGTSASFRLAANGTSLGTASVSATTTAASSVLSTPIEVDGRTTPQRVQLNVTAVSGAPADLAVDFVYQIVD